MEWRDRIEPSKFYICTPPSWEYKCGFYSTLTFVWTLKIYILSCKYSQISIFQDLYADLLSIFHQQKLAICTNMIMTLEKSLVRNIWRLANINIWVPLFVIYLSYLYINNQAFWFLWWFWNFKMLFFSNPKLTGVILFTCVILSKRVLLVEWLIISHVVKNYRHI